MQIEALSKELYYLLGGTKSRNEIFFDEDCLKLVDKTYSSSKVCVNVVSASFDLVDSSHKVLRPLKNAQKSKGTYWQRAYQAVKHDRYTCLKDGNIKALLQAMAALYLLNIYFRNINWSGKYEDINNIDYSFGSSVFSLCPPATEALWDNNSIKIDESPFVATLSEDFIKKQKKLKDVDDKNRLDFFIRQPEMKDSHFIKLLLKKQSEAEKNNNRIIPIWELAVYRLNKKIPQNLSFEERKRLFITSEEWNGSIRAQNEHLNAEELTEENIQSEIDKAGRLWGIQLDLPFEKSLNHIVKVFKTRVKVELKKNLK